MKTTKEEDRNALVREAHSLISKLPINASDKLALRFIVGRTLYYNKYAETIPSRHFLDGVAGLEGCGLTERTLRRARKRLSDRGYIRIKTQKHPIYGGYIGHKYTVILEVMRTDVMSKLKVSRKRKNDGRSPKNPYKSRAAIVAVGCGHSGRTEEQYSSSINKKNTYCAADDVDDGLDELVGRAKEKTKVARERKANKLSKSRSTSMLIASWNQACRAHYPDQRPTPVSTQLAGRFRTMTVNMLPTGDALADFVEWVVGDWDAIRAHFHWMEKPKVPLHPDLEWCARHCSRLLIGRAEIEAKKAQAATTTREQQLETELRKVQGDLWRSQSLIKPFDPERAKQRRKERKEQEALDALKPKPKPDNSPMTAEELADGDFPAWEDLPHDRK